MSRSDAPGGTGLSLRTNFSWTFVGNVINAASWFAMTIVLAKLGTPEQVGQFALGLAMTAPIFMFATLRLRDIQAVDTSSDYCFENYFALRLITTGLALLAVLLVATIAGYERELKLVIFATGISKAIEAISDVYYGLFMQQERLDRIAKSMMVKGPLSLVGLAVGFYLSGSVFWGVVGIIAARVLIGLTYDLPNAIVSLTSEDAVIRRFDFHNMPRPKGDLATLAGLAWLALPLGFVTMLISFNGNIPRYFIEHTFGAQALGIFAAVASFQKAAPTVIQALGRSASPRLAKYYAANKVRMFRKLTWQLIIIAVLLGGGGALVAYFIGTQIITLLYSAEYVTPGLFELIMVAAAFDYLATMLLFVITSARYFRVQLPLQLATALTVILLCYWFVPAAGLLGAAAAILGGNVVRVIGTSLVAWQATRALHNRAVQAPVQPTAHPA